MAGPAIVAPSVSIAPHAAVSAIDVRLGNNLVIVVGVLVSVIIIIQGEPAVISADV
jgi:hypothetical protein